jgi:CDP-diacylglycerol--serine O-phosphatidyltransferase
MIKRIDDHHDFEHRRERRRKRRLRTISMLPTLLTLGNLYFGFAAIYCCCREAEDLGRGVQADFERTLNSHFFEANAPSFLSIGFWMITASMICDALDGRVARKTGAASKFGEQLDSLADVVSFGVAPALMMVLMVRREFTSNGWIDASAFAKHYAQFGLFLAVIYVCCTALRLARFNVETSLDESAHRGFKGLPSPGAAAALVSLVFLHEHLDISVRWDRTAAVIVWTIPVITLCLALLMVSRVTYVHFLSSFLRRRPFSHVIPILLVIPLLITYTELAVTLAAWLFALSGPVRLAWKRARASGTAAPAATVVHPGDEHS